MKTDPRVLWREGKTLGEVAQNPDGTWNAIRALSAMSGLDPREVQWTANRLKELLKTHGKEDARSIVKTEAKTKPWEREGIV